MSLKAGIVGLPNVGKSTLFNAITKQNILAANYPFATIDPNIGIVNVPDERLLILDKMYQPKSLVPTSFEFIDIAGLVKGAAAGEGLGNKFLSHIREVDAIVEVVRCFNNNEIIHVTGEMNPVEDIEIINIELILADLEIVNNRVDKLIKKTKSVKDKESLAELDILNKIQKSLQENKPIRLLNLDNDEKELIKSYNFITAKPIIYVANVSEEDAITCDNIYIQQIESFIKSEEAELVVMCSKMESELIDLNNENKNKFLAELGIESSGLDKLIVATYKLLGLNTFFTAGEPEVRAWTFTKGMKAPACAGIIHSDFQKGFIKAEVMSFSDLLEFGEEKKVKEAGKLRLEGKEYIMQDGDICYFRFNV